MNSLEILSKLKYHLFFFKEYLFVGVINRIAAQNKVK